MIPTPSPSPDPTGFGGLATSPKAAVIFVIVVIAMIVYAAVSGTKDGGAGDGWR